MPQKVHQLFSKPDMPVLKFFAYLVLFVKYWHIANLANFVFRHKQQAKVNLEQIASKSSPIIFQPRYASFRIFQISHLVREILAHCELEFAMCQYFANQMRYLKNSKTGISGFKNNWGTF